MVFASIVEGGQVLREVVVPIVLLLRTVPYIAGFHGLTQILKKSKA